MCSRSYGCHKSHGFKDRISKLIVEALNEVNGFSFSRDINNYGVTCETQRIIFLQLSSAMRPLHYKQSKYYALNRKLTLYLSIWRGNNVICISSYSMKYNLSYCTQQMNTRLTLYIATLSRCSNYTAHLWPHRKVWCNDFDISFAWWKVLQCSIILCVFISHSFQTFWMRSVNGNLV